MLWVGCNLTFPALSRSLGEAVALVGCLRISEHKSHEGARPLGRDQT